MIDLDLAASVKTQQGTQTIRGTIVPTISDWSLHRPLDITLNEYHSDTSDNNKLLSATIDWGQLLTPSADRKISTIAVESFLFCNERHHTRHSLAELFVDSRPTGTPKMQGKSSGRSSALHNNPFNEEQLLQIDAYWRAANYLSVGQIYLLDNALLRQPLSREHVKSRLLGHWGTTPGLNFIYAHCNRIINNHNLNMIYVAGPDVSYG